MEQQNNVVVLMAQRCFQISCDFSNQGCLTDEIRTFYHSQFSSVFQKYCASMNSKSEDNKTCVFIAQNKEATFRELSCSCCFLRHILWQSLMKEITRIRSKLYLICATNMLLNSHETLTNYWDYFPSYKHIVICTPFPFKNRKKIRNSVSGK